MSSSPAPAPDSSAATWVAQALSQEERLPTVASLVPACFDAYTRILHPATRLTEHERATSNPRLYRWSEVAAATGREMHRLVQFDPLRGVSRYSHEQSEWDVEWGAIPRDVLMALVEILASQTEASARCWFAMWDGWGERDRIVSLQDAAAALVALPEREYILFEGPLESVLGLGYEFYGTFEPRPPTLFWPEDRAWFVANDIDLDSTYVGGTSALADALAGDARLESFPADPGDSISVASDTVNPQPDWDEGPPPDAPPPPSGHPPFH